MTTLTSQNTFTTQRKPGSLSGNALKLCSLAAVAFTITLVLFWLMSRLIAQSEPEIIELPEYVSVDPVFQEVDEKVNVRQSLPPKPEILEPPKSLPDMLEPDAASNDMNSFGVNVSIPGPDISTDNQTSLNVSGGEARPVVRIAPRYPVAAARDGKEGWVVLSFAINALGGVEDVAVLDAEPKRIFDREAIRALRKWKYRPKVVDGKPVKQSNLTVQIDFKLEQEG